MVATRVKVVVSMHFIKSLLYYTVHPCPTYKVENGRSKYIRNFLHHKCRHGYQGFGSFIRKCLPNGEWSGNTPVCILKGMKGFMTMQ